VQQVRQPAVAGTFYHSDRLVLQTNVNDLLETALLEANNVKQSENLIPPKAIIVPHAGYIYSGPTAATAYAQLSVGRDTIKRVILLGPVHRVPVNGLALPGVSIFATPLGRVQVDLDAITAIENMPQVVESVAAHALEHSLEVQLPFLQTVLEDFTLVPLAVGDATAEQVAEVLERLWGGPETVIVISSDLSHFLPYETARAIDTETVDNILNLRGPLNHQQACGGTPVNGLMLAARQHHLHPQLLDLRNSGDTAGDKNRVVGYASIAFTEGADHG
jgi:AmmeMemoRadiSam system protein B